jgi:GNAT superfamily N-acetyltransferase
VVEIERIFDLPSDIQGLMVESQAEGFRFLKRLVDDYHSGVNRFEHVGEALMVARSQGRVIAIGGINNVDGVGRLRRFYVTGQYRRAGVGRQLLKELELHAATSFADLVLFTDTTEASQFYEANGYTRVNEHDVSHRKVLSANETVIAN